MRAHEILKAAAPHIGWRVLSEKKTDCNLLVVAEGGIETCGGHGLKATLEACICKSCITGSIAAISNKLFEMDRDFRAKHPELSAMNFNLDRDEIK